MYTVAFHPQKVFKLCFNLPSALESFLWVGEAFCSFVKASPAQNLRRPDATNPKNNFGCKSAALRVSSCSSGFRVLGLLQLRPQNLRVELLRPYFLEPQALNPGSLQKPEPQALPYASQGPYYWVLKGSRAISMRSSEG